MCSSLRHESALPLVAKLQACFGDDQNWTCWTRFAWWCFYLVLLTFPETNSDFTPENWWLGDDPFLLGPCLFSGDMVVLGRVTLKGLGPIRQWIAGLCTTISKRLRGDFVEGPLVALPGISNSWRCNCQEYDVLWRFTLTSLTIVCWQCRNVDSKGWYEEIGCSALLQWFCDLLKLNPSKTQDSDDSDMTLACFVERIILPQNFAKLLLYHCCMKANW